MFKSRSNFVFIIFTIISVAEIALVLQFIPVSNEFLFNSVYVYIALALVVAFILLKFVVLADSKKPKEEVKIIYKNFDKNTVNQDFTEKKAVEKIDKIVDTTVIGLAEQTDVLKFSEAILKSFSKNFQIVQGLFYIFEKETNKYKSIGNYAHYQTDVIKTFEIGEGIVGQVAKNKKILFIDNVPDNYIKILSGLGEGTPRNLLFIPIIHDEQTIAIIEYASFVEPPNHYDKIFASIANKISETLIKLL